MEPEPPGEGVGGAAGGAAGRAGAGGVAGPGGPTVWTVDGEPLPAEEALRSARRNLRFGCLGLPWLWAVNVWLYWPVLTKAGSRAAAAAGGDLLLFRQCVARSALGAGVAAAALLAWVLAYQLGGPGLLGAAYEKLDVVGAFY